MRPSNPLLVTSLGVLFAAASCTLITDVDRSKIDVGVAGSAPNNNAGGGVANGGQPSDRGGMPSTMGGASGDGGRGGSTDGGMPSAGGAGGAGGASSEGGAAGTPPASAGVGGVP